MEKQEDINLRIMRQGIAGAVRLSESNLETVTKNLDRNFKGLDLHKLPEYEAAMRAIEAYGSAAVTLFSKKYKESLRS